VNKMNHNTLKTTVWVGAYQKPNTMKHRHPVGESATTPQSKRVWLYLCQVLGQAPFILKEQWGLNLASNEGL